MRFLTLYRYYRFLNMSIVEAACRPTSCGAADMLTVTPDRAALEVAHSRLRVTAPLDEMLKKQASRLFWRQ